MSKSGGGHIKKGAKAICVIFYKKITVEDKETEEEKKPKVFSLIWRQAFYGTSFKAPTVYVQTRYFWKEDFMSLKKVCQRWGEHSLDIAKFKSANEDESIRARMSCSLLKNQKKYIGKDRSEIRNLWGLLWTLF